MDGELSCRVFETGDTIVIAAEGDVDLATCDRLTDRAAAHLRPGTRVVVDCSEITFLDSAGLRVLLDLRARTAAVGSVFALAAIPSPVRLVLELSGTEHYFLTLDARPDGDRGASEPTGVTPAPPGDASPSNLRRPSRERSSG
jgi:anti-anti-sigma factor